MKKHFLLPFVLIFTVINMVPVFADYTALKPIPIQSAEIAPETAADSAIVINADTGDIIYGKNIHKKQYPASITKLMTVLLTLENGNTGDIMTFSHDAVFSIERNSNHIAIDVGEELSVADALYAVMLESANEVANGLAEYISGDMDTFASLMTSRAKELGAKNTNFTNANGLHDDNHYTTAYDMALIAKELLKFDIFKDVAKTVSYQIQPTNLQPEVRYMNMQNKMVIPSSPYYYEYCIGGKTGFTDQALNTLVTYAEKDGMTLICVVLNENGAPLTYKDSAAFFDYAFNNYKTVSVFSAEGYTTTVKCGSDPITLKADRDFYTTLPKGANASDVQKKFVCPEVVSGPVSKGDIIGNIEFYYNGVSLGKVNLVADTASAAAASARVSKPAFSAKSLVLPAVIIVIAIIVFIILCNELNYRKKRAKRRKRLEELKNTDKALKRR